MKIVNFNEFLGFTEDMTTKYKFYRTVAGQLQAFVVGRDGLIIYSETDKSKHKIEIVTRGFIETELTKEEIAGLGL